MYVYTKCCYMYIHDVQLYRKLLPCSQRVSQSEKVTVCIILSFICTHEFLHQYSVFPLRIFATYVHVRIHVYVHTYRTCTCIYLQVCTRVYVWTISAGSWILNLSTWCCCLPVAARERGQSVSQSVGNCSSWCVQLYVYSWALESVDG